MDNSIYTSSAGTLTPVLAGRDGVLRNISLALTEVTTVGRARAQHLILVGRRGVGNTVTLTTYGAMPAAVDVENGNQMCRMPGPFAVFLAGGLAARTR